MEASLLGTIVVIALGFVSAWALFARELSHRRSLHLLQALGPNKTTHLIQGEHSAATTSGDTINEFVRLKNIAQQQITASKRTGHIHDRFFQAGIFSREERARFYFWRRCLMVVCTLLFGSLGCLVEPLMGILAALLGLLVGMQLPRSLLRRSIEQRNEEIMFYLPLVIEQLVLGVSSSLDVGPCMQWVVAMADERDSHNAVTELLRYAQQYMKSGVSMEEALVEIARLSGHTELKHVFMSLSQVARHGGEITKQLQELANAVASQREARTETKIRKLEIEATGPVGLVFIAFLGIFMVGLGTQVTRVFQ
jgi:Flp pilus assembly protein TadB